MYQGLDHSSEMTVTLSDQKGDNVPVIVYNFGGIE